MNGGKLVLDTNIVLYFLGGDQVLSSLVDQREIYISAISEMELPGFPGITEQETNRIRIFLLDCQIIEIVPPVREIAIEIRRQYQLKLPDAIIAASAVHVNQPLISSDQAFDRVVDLNFIHYKF